MPGGWNGEDDFEVGSGKEPVGRGGVRGLTTLLLCSFTPSPSIERREAGTDKGREDDLNERVAESDSISRALDQSLKRLFFAKGWNDNHEVSAAPNGNIVVVTTRTSTHPPPPLHSTPSSPKADF
ncbi:hypothetical protein GYMLUDRAFT_252728 [Collybiopsis luxurians FD-317 M1]|uniref:Uncharacterized protein n=1 Tax=Collybiopsis luxurians FD-317 M1 TaxID=944289 RepID=A0A0D0B954_9AGAR|nr:hypothetical protein GYMLUDRAFT_252728 [Collybiopsis luxurians FD-317 M1]